MPAVIPFAISAVASAAGYAAVGTVLSLVSAAVIGSYQASQAKKKAREQYNAAQVDRLANVVATAAPRELVLGRVRKGGTVSFRGAAGKNNGSFFVHIVLAAHEIDAIEGIWFNDQQITVDPSTGEVLTSPYRRVQRQPVTYTTIPAGQTSVTLPQDPVGGSASASIQSGSGDTASYVSVPCTQSGRTVTIPVQTVDVNVAYQYEVYVTFAWVYTDLGAPGSVADGNTVAAFPGVWTSAHRGEGVAKLVLRLDYDETAFPSGIPVVTALIRGAKVYDPRNGLTVWTENPALLARHVYQHPQFGKATVSAAEDARFSAAANACDVTQNWVVNGATQSTQLYRAGLVAPFGTPAADLLNNLTQAMAGQWAFTGGELFVHAGVYSAPVLTFYDADLANVQRTGDKEQQEQLKISVHRDRANQFNVVNVRVWDGSQDYKDVQLPPLKGYPLIARDGHELSQDVQFPAVSFAPQALHIAGVMMRDARDPLTIEVPMKMSAYAVELFDIIQLALTRYGWASVPKTFLVLGRVWDREKGVIRLSLKETSAAIYTPDAAFLAQGYATNTSLPSPWNVDAPGALTISSGTGELAVAADGTVITRVRVAWPTITDPRVNPGGKVEVQWASLVDGIWHSISVDGSGSEAFITNVTDGTAILVRARSRTGLALSDWGVMQQHVVIGKSALPQDVTSFAVDRSGVATWTLVPDADVRAGGGYFMRWQPGNNRSWGDATPVHDGVLTDSPYAIIIRPAGLATFMLKAVDSSGNESANAAVSVINLGDPLVSNVVVATDYKALGFPGTVVNASVSGGNLVADSDPSPVSWDPNPETVGWSLDTDPGWTAITYKPVTYTPDVYIVDSANEGAQLTLQNTITATAFLISYRRDGDFPGWTSDAEPGWTSDTALAWLTEDYRPWPGTVSARAGRYEFNLAMQSRDVQTVISLLAAQIDVPDVIESVGRVSISPGGTVIPATKPFRKVTAINLTLVADGGSAVNVRIEDEATRTITTRDVSGTAVAGTVLATLQGY